ncbi:hypothetical protein OQA88_10238 [Cercophora sp. LCS_1]
MTAATVVPVGETLAQAGSAVAQNLATVATTVAAAEGSLVQIGKVVTVVIAAAVVMNQARTPVRALARTGKAVLSILVRIGEVVMAMIVLPVAKALARSGHAPVQSLATPGQIVANLANFGRIGSLATTGQICAPVETSVVQSAALVPAGVDTAATLAMAGKSAVVQTVVVVVMALAATATLVTPRATDLPKGLSRSGSGPTTGHPVDIVATNVEGTG